MAAKRRKKRITVTSEDSANYEKTECSKGEPRQDEKAIKKGKGKGGLQRSRNEGKAEQRMGGGAKPSKGGEPAHKLRCGR